MEITLDLEQCLSCPVCGQGRADPESPVYRTQHMGIDVVYATCPVCRNYWLINRMTDEFTEKYYKEYYRKITTPTEERKEINKNYEKMRATYQLEMLKRNGIEGKSILDVGCSHGILLQRLRDELNCDVAGVEVGENGLDILAFDSLQDIEDHNFDVIVLSHVLEHQNYPIKFLQDVLKKAKIGGRVLIDVPNSNVDVLSFLIHHPIAFTWVGLSYVAELLGMEMRDYLWYDPFSTPIFRSMMVLLEI